MPHLVSGRGGGETGVEFLLGADITNSVIRHCFLLIFEDTTVPNCLYGTRPSELVQGSVGEGNLCENDNDARVSLVGLVAFPPAAFSSGRFFTNFQQVGCNWLEDLCVG